MLNRVQVQLIWKGPNVTFMSCFYSYDMMVAKLILLHFGAFVPGNAGEPPKMSMECGCSGFACHQNCLGPADQNWPQAVGSGILNVVLKGMFCTKQTFSLDHQAQART